MFILSIQDKTMTMTLDTGPRNPLAFPQTKRRELVFGFLQVTVADDSLRKRQSAQTPKIGDVSRRRQFVRRWLLAGGDDGFAAETIVCRRRLRRRQSMSRRRRYAVAAAETTVLQAETPVCGGGCGDDDLQAQTPVCGGGCGDDGLQAQTTVCREVVVR